jgi:hypothetical protein
VFSAKAGQQLNYYFNYVTSDGGKFHDYAWAQLQTSLGVPVAMLFTARTEPSGNTVPGLGLPPIGSTLTPTTASIIAGGPTWSKLGTFDSGTCFAAGCGYTGWISENYTIVSAGNYQVEFGAANWINKFSNSGLAFDVAPVATPLPAALPLFATGLGVMGFIARRRKQKTAAVAA